MSIDNLEAFAAYLANQEGHAERTVQTYLGAVGLWRKWLAGRPETEDHAVTWLSGFASPRTRNTYASALRSFFGWQGQRLRIKVRIGQQLPQPVSLEELISMVTVSQGRNRLLILSLAFTGLRVHEVVKLRLSDLVPDSPAIRISGKGSKERLIDIPPTLYRMLQDQAKGVRDGRIFVGRDRRRGLSISSVERIVSETGQMVGLDVHPHRLRHFFGTWYYALCRDPFRTARAMGHSDPKTTYGYAGLVQPPPGITDMEDLLAYILGRVD